MMNVKRTKAIARKKLTVAIKQIGPTILHITLSYIDNQQLLLYMDQKMRSKTDRREPKEK